MGNRHLDTQTYSHPSPPRQQDQDLPGGLGLDRKRWSLQGIFKSGSAKQQPYSLADIQRGEGRRDERTEISFLPSPTPMVIELPIWSGKGPRGEKQCTCNGQETVSRAIHTGRSGVSFRQHELQFLPSGVTTKLIPSSGTLDEDISLWPEILPFQHKVSASMNHFLPSCQKFLHKLYTGQQQEPAFKRGPSSGAGGGEGGLVPLSLL